jgi:hypothetical protein
MKLTGEQLYNLDTGTAVRVLSDSLGKFKPGDIVHRTRAPDDCHQSSKFVNCCGTTNFMTYEEVELIVDEKPSAVAACGTIARPVLEERKVGKIQTELFEGGFPNAMMKVAEVMTWAAENKGYKPHDWKNLPNPERAFQGAGGRHRIKHNIMRGAGFSADTCVDEESCVFDKAHQSINFGGVGVVIF